MDGQRTDPPEFGALLSVLPYAVLVLDAADQVQYINLAGEQLFQAGASHIKGRKLSRFLPEDSPVFGLIGQVRSTGSSVTEYDVTVSAPRTGERMLTIQGAPFSASGGAVSDIVLSFNELSIARKIERQLAHRGAARSVAAMAAMLAHEVKNPLSGIRGAAQLLEHEAAPSERELTQLICGETDRICALVDRMSTFADDRPLERAEVNIHEVLDHVVRLGRAGFASEVNIVENYDPSLPAVFGNRDQLIQVYLNLLKNAAEAVPANGGEIIISTAYRHGVRMAPPGGGDRIELPLVISLQDNGDGIPEDIVGHLFDPFVTTKANGSGLGLALVAKVIDDHGGMIEVDSFPRRTVFKVMLPVAAGTENDAGAGAEKKVPQGAAGADA